MIQCTSLLDTPEITIDRLGHPSDHPHHDPVEEVATVYAISRVERGSFEIQVGRQRWTLGPGSVFLCYPGLVHRYHHHQANPVDVCVSVSYRSLPACVAEDSALTNLASFARQHQLVPPTNRLAYLFRQVALRAPASQDRMATESSAAALLTEISKGMAGRRKLYAKHQLAWYAERIDAVRNLLHTQYAADHNLASLARSVGMSTFHFARIFTELAGMPPHRYLLGVRLEKAAYRLNQGSSVTEACFASGFSNLSHFIRSFRRRFGNPPGKHSGGPGQASRTPS